MLRRLGEDFSLHREDREDCSVSKACKKQKHMIG